MSLCVYAIVGRPLGRRLVMNANGAKVRSVRAGATSAVVADCAGPLSPTVRALRGHDAVVRRIAGVVPALLPVRFGTLVDSDRSLVALLDAWSEDLQKALALVDRQCQMTLRLFALAGTAVAAGDVFSIGGLSTLLLTGSDGRAWAPWQSRPSRNR